MKPAHIKQENWMDYRWQLANVIQSPDQIKAFFPTINEEQLKAIGLYQEHYRFRLTPYLLSSLGITEDTNFSSLSSLARLFLPDPTTLWLDGPEEYKAEKMNWEMPEDLVVPETSAFQLKYSDRLLYRSTGCMSICSYCFEAHRVIDKFTDKKPKRSDWELGIEWLKVHSQVREFVFSGGDPLLAPDDILEQRLRDLRNIPHIETIRFNTAVLMHCPMRITKEVIEIFKRYEVTEMGVHIVHPSQITVEFNETLKRFDDFGYGSLIKLAQIPLLAGVNDNTKTLKELLTQLEQHRIKAYYLLHGLPWTLGAVKFRTSVKKGVEIIKPLYRHLSHVAWPEYVIVARGGKATVPLESTEFWLEENQVNHLVWSIDNDTFPLSHFSSEQRQGLYKFFGTPKFIYSKYKDKPVIVFLNWKNQWEMYLDSENDI